jgi:HupH hydrogenase expression protein, C-terminal conserved region
MQALEENEGHGRGALRSIAVKVEMSSGNIEPLFHQIRHALQRLLREGSGVVIDLKAIPLAPGEEERILQLLGSGEVCAELNAFGRSEVRETAFPAVWVVTHYDTQDAPRTRFIEVTRIPPILCSQTPDITDGLARLEALADNGFEQVSNVV